MSTNSGDTYRVEVSKQTQRERTPYSKREIIYAVDTNSGSYSGNQVQFDLSQFANVTSGLLDFANASLQIPVVITATAPNSATGDTAPPSLDGFVNVKNGFAWNIINSISVNIDGKEMITPNSLYNGFVSYKMLSSMSADDLNNFGATHLFTGPEETRTWLYNDTEATTISATNPSRIQAGNGLCNNAPFIKTSRFPASGTTVNNGYWEFGNKPYLDRLTLINNRPDDVYTQAAAAAPAVINQNLGKIRNGTNFSNELKNYTIVTKDATNTGNGFVQQWFVLCNVKLSFLSDIFNNLPLVRGLYAKMNLVLNLGSMVVRCQSHAQNVAGSLHVRPGEIFFQNFNPLEVTERSVASDTHLPIAMPGERYLISVGVVKAPSTSHPDFTSHATKATNIHSLTSCRISIPVVHMKPDELVSYLETTKEQRVEYTDVYQTTISNVGKEKPFDALISNGTKDVIGLLIVPTISGQSNGIVAGGPAEITTSGFSTNLSPFVGEMVTPLSITQLQVLFGSENILPDRLNYTYDTFMHHVQDYGKINGNYSLGLNSGLLSQQQWEDYYRYYWISLNRKLEEDTMPKSINIKGFNNSQVTADYIVYVISKKSFVVNTSTGRVST